MEIDDIYLTDFQEIFKIGKSFKSNYQSMLSLEI